MNTHTAKILFLSFLMVSTMSAQAKEIAVTVRGMVCGFCAQGIEKKLKALKEVESVNVSLEKKLVKIQTKGEQDLSDTQINDLMKEAGYNVEKIVRDGKT
jgi:mercuric ion binding protein